MGGMKKHVVGGVPEKGIRLIIICVAGAAVGQISPGRHGNNTSRHGKPVIPQIHDESQSQPAACGISCYDDMVRLVLLFLNQPLIRIDCILQGRRIRILRSHPVINREHISAKTQLGIPDCEFPVNILHGADVTASMQLQNHTSRKDPLRT